jgi:transcriptional regulator with XRE-family HTH domain
VPMHALARLIEDVIATHGWNQAELGRRAGLSRSRITQLISEPIKAVPGRDTIIKLARGLGVPPWVVMDAVLDSAGLPTRPTHVTVEEAVAADISLNAAGKEAVLAVVHHMREQAAKPQPDYSRVQGVVLQDTNPNLRVVQQTNGQEGT